MWELFKEIYDCFDLFLKNLKNTPSEKHSAVVYRCSTVIVIQVNIALAYKQVKCWYASAKSGRSGVGDW